MDNKTQTAPLFEMCLHILEANINMDNCFDALSLGEAYSLPELKKNAIHYVLLKNFKDVCQELRFLQLKANTLIDILQNDSLNVKNESEVLDAVMRWLHFQEEHKQHLHKVLEHVRLAHIEPAELSDRVEREEALQQSEPVRKLLDRVKDYHSFPSRRLTNQSSITRRRFNSPQIETLEVIQGYPNYEREYISEDGRKFENFPRPTHDKSYTERWFPCNFKLGCTFYERTDLPFRLFIFDFDKGAWTESARFTRPQLDVRLCEADGIWYAVGGREPGHRTCCTNLDSYDPSTNKWTPLAPLLDAMQYHKVLSLSGSLYVFDYRYGSHYHLIMHEYNIERNEWTDTPLLPDFFCHLADCCALNNRIYVSCRDQVDLEDCVTGFEGGRIFEYNVETRKWRKCATTNHEFIDGPVILNGRICVLTADEDDDIYRKYFERYDPELDSWSDVRTFVGHAMKYIGGPYLVNNNWEIVSEDESAT